MNDITEEVDREEDAKCAVCKGTGSIELLDSECPYCNGTGEYTRAAEVWFKNHICQCILLDKKNCPICNKKCHHNSHLNPKILLLPS